MAGIDDKYIKVQGWMATQLGLHGNELIVYAYIYSFQFKNFIGKDTSANVEETEIPIRDFMEWTGLTKRGIIYIVQSLQEKGLITAKTKPGASNAYSILPEPVKKALKGEKVGGEKIAPLKDCGEKIAPVKKLHQGGEVHCTTGGEIIAPGVVKEEAKSGEKIAPHLQHNYLDNKETTSTTTRTRVQSDASASLSSTDTEDGYEDLSKSEIAFFEKQALKKLNETDETTGQKLYLTKDPRDQFPKAFLFMMSKDTSQFTDTEFELFKMVSMYTAFGPAKPLPTVSEEDAKYVPPASEIGQEAHDSQQALVDWLFEGGPSPSSYAHDAPLQSRRQK